MIFSSEKMKIEPFGHKHQRSVTPDAHQKHLSLHLLINKKDSSFLSITPHSFLSFVVVESSYTEPSPRIPPTARYPAFHRRKNGVWVRAMYEQLI